MTDADSVQERNGIVTMKGNPLTLLGPAREAGDPAPEATLVKADLSEVKLSSFRGEKILIASVPSLDTPVCDMESKRFNKEAGSIGGAKILVVSMDLPFAQKRWCGANSAESILTLSDHREASFGMNYGVLIKEARLLARAIFVIDTGGTIRYTEIVPEVADAPDYDAALSALKEA